MLGPTRPLELEGSKIFAKEFMERHGIPTARVYGICESSRRRIALRTLNGRSCSRRTAFARAKACW